MLRRLLPTLMLLMLTDCSKTDDRTGVAGAISQLKPHADHTPRHGGVLTMEGDNHVEIVVGKDGEIDLYVSDAVRQPIPTKDISGSITIESPKGKGKKQVLPLSEDAVKSSLSAKGPPPIDDNDYTWNLHVRRQPMLMTLQVPAGGTLSIGNDVASGHGDDHQHGSVHGGVVQSLANGHVEVKLTQGGEATLWLLDDSERPRSAKGTTASIQLVLAGSKEITLAYDEKLDALHGRIDPPTIRHFDAIVTVTSGISPPTPLRISFDL